ncbi:DNA-3-methyladenine glycosylase 2 family protein [Labrys neptuniae]|uniref:DNA-3-methyladenine glycosylase family protein n=1 Tax=Labrys neptuniae TaxID=376174 RepID=UPI00288FD3EE|nr:DNA-3-methyladenine glycosylase 2 family protein [Labrys neptuniae]MDT3378726.1 DNA-3-methyladenine glycosylase 2 family protein [Labrys neptuniae]
MTVIIRSRTEILAGVEALRALDPRLAAIYDLCGEPPLRRNEGGLEGLAWIIVSQQVSVASARAIWARTKAVFDPFTAQRLVSAPEADFRAGGLSMPKIRTLRAVGQAMLEGLDLDALAVLSADAARLELTRVKGIGPWTADIYLMFCLGHGDAFASGDLALQEAARMLLDLEKRPDAAELARIAEAWRPWRSVAARLLFAYYAKMKNRAGVALE